MGCGCKKGRGNSQNSLGRYAFLTPSQIEDKKRLEEEERRKIETERFKQGRKGK